MFGKKGELSATDFMAQYVDGLVHAANTLAEATTDDSYQQWNAYCEFTYALVFLCDQHLGRALAANGHSGDSIQRVIGVVDKIVLTCMLGQRSVVDVNSDLAERMYVEHHLVLEERANRWLGMPTFGAEGQGPAGTFVWEVPKQAAQSAGASAKSTAILTTGLTFPATLLALKIPQAMEYVANRLAPR
jgi:hypothetical protein